MVVNLTEAEWRIYTSALTVIGSDNSLLSGGRQAIIWTNVNWTPRNKFNQNFNRNAYISVRKNTFQNVVPNMMAILSRPQWVKIRIRICGINYRCLHFQLSIWPWINRHGRWELTMAPWRHEPWMGTVIQPSQDGVVHTPWSTPTRRGEWICKSYHMCIMSTSCDAIS